VGGQATRSTHAGHLAARPTLLAEHVPLGQQVGWGSQVCASSGTTVANRLSWPLSQRVYHPPLRGVDPDTRCDRDDRRRAQPDVGPFLQRTVNGPPDSPKVVDDDCPVGGLSEGTESSDGAALVTCDNFAE
jgi:hypothetical protein